ncbi:signal peptidase I [Candidatus Peregrinibacteria bacterium]|jgi:signal peptidase I|nr:signal peptidase I [Candidatus Peregrinibacteria bacterium]MBT4056421.1 signal peptidase I [Candidatus Peregrinibacteria bacterium]
MNFLKNIKSNKKLVWAIDISLNIAIVLGTVFLIKTFLVAPFDIYGPSMCNNLNFLDGECEKEYGEKLFLNKALYYIADPARGDIVVFTPRFSDEKYYIKRVIGLPGETVEILNGEVYVTNHENLGGIKLEEPYLSDANKGQTRSFTNSPSVFKVPEGEYFMLGDNRRASTDSRSCFHNPFEGGCKDKTNNAFVPKSNMEGKSWLVFWPIGSIRTLDDPEYEELEN